MTWTISHGAPGGQFDGYHSYSYSRIEEWRQALLAVVRSNHDRTVLEPLTRRRTDCQFEIQPARAAAIANVLRSVQRQMPRGQRELTEALAAAAERAAAAGEPWRWS